MTGLPIRLGTGIPDSIGWAQCRTFDGSGDRRSAPATTGGRDGVVEVGPRDIRAERGGNPGGVPHR